MVAVPALLDVALTVIWTESPADREKPEKVYESF